uniref:Uncharacterized protein n=1 Tax=Kalanchoe fedtschenkoi TaxID=63787 RepID=A0A7N1A6P7_KALFE
MLGSVAAGSGGRVAVVGKVGSFGKVGSGGTAVGLGRDDGSVGFGRDGSGGSVTFGRLGIVGNVGWGRVGNAGKGGVSVCWRRWRAARAESMPESASATRKHRMKVLEAILGCCNWCTEQMFFFV